MMIDEMNKLPIDPAWMKNVIAVTEHAAKELDCMVVLIAIQEHGKLAIEIGGIPESGPLSDLAKNPPRLLATLGYACAAQDAMQRKGHKQ